MGTLRYRGQISIAGLCPIVVECNALILAELQAKLAGVLALSVQLSITPPTLAANLDIAVELVAALTASIEIGLPGIDFQIAAVAALVAQLQLNLALLLSLDVLLGATLMAYTWEGPANELGPAVTSEFAVELPDGTSSYAPVNAILLVTPSPVAWVSIRALFGGL